MSGTHGISTPLQIIDYYDVDQLPDESRPWYEETRQAIYGLQEGMQRLHWVLCTLSPVSEDVRCPENPKIPSVLWSSLGTLLFRANPDGVEIMTPEQVLFHKPVCHQCFMTILLSVLRDRGEYL